MVSLVKHQGERSVCDNVGPCMYLEITVLVHENVAWFLQMRWITKRSACHGTVVNWSKRPMTRKYYTRSRWTTPAECMYLRPRYWEGKGKTGGLIMDNIEGIWVDEVTYQDLVQKVLNKLLVQGPRGQQTMEISSEQLCHKVTIGGEIWRHGVRRFCVCSEQNGMFLRARLAPTYMSSSGEMKMSLRLII